MKKIILLGALFLLVSCTKQSTKLDPIVGKYKCTNEYDYWDLSGTLIHIVKTDTLTVTKAADDKIYIDPDYNLTSSESPYSLDGEYSFYYTEGDGIPEVRIQFFLANDSITFHSQTGGLGGRSIYTIHGNKIE